MNTVMESRGTQLFGGIGLFVGGVVLVVGLAIGVTRLIKYSSMKRVVGVVVKYERGKGMKGESPHVRYFVNEQEYFASARVHSDQGYGIAVGEELGVLYAPDRPEIGYLDLFAEKWFTTLLVLLVGTCMTIISAILRFGPANKVVSSR